MILYFQTIEILRSAPDDGKRLHLINRQIKMAFTENRKQEN
jgi:hypothetical protein